MADTKLSALTSITPVVATDYVYGDQASGPTSGKILLSTLKVFTGSGLVSVTPTADSAVTMASGNVYLASVVGFTADRTFTCPASPAVGDIVGIIGLTANASFELVVAGNTGQSINGGSAASEWSRLFIANECVILQYVATNDWRVIYDGRIPQVGSMYLSTAPDGETAATYTRPTQASTPGAWTIETNVGSVCSTTLDRLTVRRGSICQWTAVWNQKDGSATAKYFGGNVIFNAGATERMFGFVHTSLNATPAPSVVDTLTMTNATDDYGVYQYRSTDGSLGLYVTSARNRFSVREILH